MLMTRDSQVVTILKKRIQVITAIKRMIVFGSHARGDATEESDLDVFIEVDRLTPGLHDKISDLAWEVGFEHNLVISPFVASTDQITHGLISANPILKVIENEGVPV